MHLTTEEQAWLAGEAGSAIRRAMEIVAALGNIYGATHLLPVQRVQISGVSYRNIGAAGLDFLTNWVAEGARVHASTTLNPTAMDMRDWAEQGFSPDFAKKQQQVVDTFARMGVGSGYPIPTCTPYLMGNHPEFGEHIAWAESSAVVYANSVLGARTNREGGPGAIAAAIVGRTAAYGLHLPENRIGTLKVTVNAIPRTLSDYSALGAWVGKAAHRAVPYFVGLPLSRGSALWEEKLKTLGAAMAATGAVALYHVAGVTPEALTPVTGARSILAATHTEITIDDLAPGYALLNDPVEDIDLVWIGCPHASLLEVSLVAQAVAGLRLRVPLWVTCARPVKDAAIACGLAAVIEAAGGRIFADACIAIAPVRDLGFERVATPSAKGAYYLRNLAGIAARFASLEQCVEAAIKGKLEIKN
ncbi:MAG: aconitase X catalytic domain-containing protein [Anaerolineae bacterium]|nr:aconitase X catalytic domain-containing protein [Anaerolineae bacterium]